MTIITILKIAGIVLGTSSITGLASWIIGRFKLKKTHKAEIEKISHKLAEEIRRNQEKEKQITDLLEFQSNDSEIEKEMNEHVKILRKAGSNDNVKEELKKVSNTIRNIYRSR